MERARNNTVDVTKMVAAFGVIIIHLAPSTPAAETLSRIFSSFAVPFFLTIALYFFIARVLSLEWLRVSHLRLDRILVPYAAWTLIYLALRLIKYRVQHRVVHLELVPAIFYGGTAVQMYFLPLLLLFQAQGLSLLLLFRNSRRRLFGIFLLFGAFIFGYIGSYEDYFGFQNCLGRGYIYIFAAILLRYCQSQKFGRLLNVVAGGLIAGLILVAAVVDYHPGWQVFVAGPLAGYSFAALALNLKLPPFKAPWRSVIGCSYGIYLAHPLFLEAFQVIATRMGWELAPYSILAKLLMSLLISACCILLIWICRSSRISAYCLLGEATTEANQTAASLSSSVARAL
jgi:peptidoglycan/LPS O-acetylase OafA/YrhL